MTVGSDLCRARSGDLALFEIYRSHAYLHGKSEYRYSYIFAKVTATTMDGRIRRAVRPDSLPLPWGLGDGNSWVVPADRLNGHSTDDVLTRCGDHYPSMEAARDAVRAVTVQTGPMENGSGGPGRIQ